MLSKQPSPSLASGGTKCANQRTQWSDHLSKWTLPTTHWNADYNLVSPVEKSTRKERPTQQTAISGFISNSAFQHNLIYWHLLVLYISLSETLRNRPTQF